MGRIEPVIARKPKPKKKTAIKKRSSKSKNPKSGTRLEIIESIIHRKTAKKAGKKPTKKKASKARSAASKKGWATRRKNAKKSRR